jgi:curved DNA-binding protein CbpA
VNPYEVLGVAKDATLEQIRRAYRSLSKKRHPDAGGSPEAMRDLNRAHDILSDPVKRKSFDETGSADHADTEFQQAASHISTLFISAIDAPNPLEVTRDRIKTDLENFRRRIQAGEAQLVRIEKAADRLTYRGEGPDILRQALEGKRVEVEQNRKNYEAALLTGSRMLELLSAYEYAAPTEQPPSRNFVRWNTAAAAELLDSIS